VAKLELFAAAVAATAVIKTVAKVNCIILLLVINGGSDGRACSSFAGEQYS
jgi:hypothetical protein